MRLRAVLPAHVQAGITNAVTTAWRLASFTVALLLTLKTQRAYERCVRGCSGAAGCQR
jgi:hypothetical protein